MPVVPQDRQAPDGSLGSCGLSLDSCCLPGPLSSHYNKVLAAPLSPTVPALQPRSYFCFLFPCLFFPLFCGWFSFWHTSEQLGRTRPVEGSLRPPSFSLYL